MVPGPEICVVGSVNLDLVVTVDHVPVVGETVLGGDLRRIPGGKGANQAVAAARLGRRVAFVGRVGNDEAGEYLGAELAAAGVDIAGLLSSQDAPTGAALIAVQADGDNAIVVSPGANHRLTGTDVASSTVVADAKVVLAQGEVALEAVQAAARHGTGLFVWNPAPMPEWAGEVLALVDVLVPNQTELGALVGGAVPDDLDSIADMARSIRCPVTIVTLGAAGALVVEAHGVRHVPAPLVRPVDTTAAGDAFCGALADAFVRGLGPIGATEWAVRVGAAATLMAGAQPSLPTPAEVEERLAASDRPRH